MTELPERTGYEKGFVSCGAKPGEIILGIDVGSFIGHTCKPFDFSCLDDLNYLVRSPQCIVKLPQGRMFLVLAHFKNSTKDKDGNFFPDDFLMEQWRLLKSKLDEEYGFSDCVKLWRGVDSETT